MIGFSRFFRFKVDGRNATGDRPAVDVKESKRSKKKEDTKKKRNDRPHNDDYIADRRRRLPVRYGLHHPRVVVVVVADHSSSGLDLIVST